MSKSVLEPGLFIEMSASERIDELSAMRSSDRAQFLLSVVTLFDQIIVSVRSASNQRYSECIQGYEDENLRRNEGLDKLSDEVNRLNNELEQAQKVIDALLEARIAHIDVARAITAAAAADLEILLVGHRNFSVCD